MVLIGFSLHNYISVFMIQKFTGNCNTAVDFLSFVCRLNKKAPPKAHINNDLWGCKLSNMKNLYS